LPEILEINASVLPETKYRGIFETVVYKSKIKITGSFSSLDWELARVDDQEILKNRASLCIGIPDVRGIREATSITFLGQKLEAKPGLPTQEVLSSGISSLINLTEDNGSMLFDIELHLDGSSSLAFSPLGKTTSIEMSSPWTAPSFDGAFLPLKKNIGTDGFSASWKVLHLNRSIPHAWTGSAPSSGGGANWKNGQLFAGPANILSDFAFGVKFYMPNDVYQKTTRMAKYAILFLVFGFTSFFFTEILQKAQVHPIQYLLVGFAILVFYLLLLSLSEHFGFDRAYLASTAAVVLLIGSYASAILSSQKLAISVSAVLSILYGYLYVILQLESYALLMGSIGLFAALAMAMFFTRKIDWYSLRLPSGDSK
jgi:inner membrane protein